MVNLISRMIFSIATPDPAHILAILLKNYPLFTGYVLGKFTHSLPGNKWVKVFRNTVGMRFIN